MIGVVMLGAIMLYFLCVTIYMFYDLAKGIIRYVEKKYNRVKELENIVICNNCSSKDLRYSLLSSRYHCNQCTWSSKVMRKKEVR